MKINTILLMFFSCVVGPQLPAEQEDIPDFDRVEFNVSNVRNFIDKNQPEKAFQILLDSTNSKDAKTRRRAYDLLILGLFKQHPEYRTKVVEVLTSKLKVENKNRIRFNFPPEYYSKKSKQNLIDIFRKEKQCVKLLGHINATELIPEFREEIAKSDGKNPEGIFVYHQALARMGDKDEIDYCISYLDRRGYKYLEQWKNNYPKKIVTDEKAKDLFNVGRANNANEYTYIRQPDTIFILKELLFLKDEPDLEPPHRQLNRYAFDALAECLDLKGVIKKNQFGEYIATKENIELLRKWMKSQYTPEKITSLSVLSDRHITNNFTGKKIKTPPNKPYKEEPVPTSIKPFLANIYKKRMHKKIIIGYEGEEVWSKEEYFTKTNHLFREVPLAKEIMEGPYLRYHTTKSKEGHFDKIDILGEYSDGKKDGLFTFFYGNSKVHRQSQYRNGRKHGVELEWREDGTISQKTTYLGGKKNGIEKSFDNEGYLVYECYYLNNNREGIAREYNKDGTVKYEYIWRRNAEWKGVFIREVFVKDLGRPLTKLYEYKDGKLIKESFYEPKKVKIK